jgi:hypothetical protein
LIILQKRENSMEERKSKSLMELTARHWMINQMKSIKIFLDGTMSNQIHKTVIKITARRKGNENH